MPGRAHMLRLCQCCPMWFFCFHLRYAIPHFESSAALEWGKLSVAT
jgi:hypothetical protein